MAVRHESLAQSVMHLFLGTSLLLVVTQVSSHPTAMEGFVGVDWLKPIAIRYPGPIFTATHRAKQLMGTRLVVRLKQRKVMVYRYHQLQASYPLAVGKAGWETPIGHFQVIQMQKNPIWIHPITNRPIPAGRDNPLGARWIGFWSDGHTQIGFHGTPEEDLIGEAVSHGCLRMRNRDIVTLYPQISPGTPVIVEP